MKTQRFYTVVAGKIDIETIDVQRTDLHAEVIGYMDVDGVRYYSSYAGAWHWLNEILSNNLDRAEQDMREFYELKPPKSEVEV